MMHDEKEQLLTLFASPGAWCRNAEAVDVNGEHVAYDNAMAVAWDLSGAMCHLFGWQRAFVLFDQCDRHIHGKRETYGWPVPDEELRAMISLQEFNDRDDTTLEVIRGQIESMPIWRNGTEGSQLQSAFGEKETKACDSQAAS
ncbi:MAG: hypothetical protein J5J06_00265 [Phycisphaerae bacterium]|nr:hypothetical protein [Phycisphaerae bacterium]